MSFGQEDLIKSDIHAFLKQHENKELLRFVAVGSVDDGKSTLIGRMLTDAKGVYEDQLQDATSVENGEEVIDFARITDGLQAEREQGITIDVAYRYFSTPKRKFIIADTPGHIQYTRNMVTGASTADVAIILIDARNGVLQQSKRHAFIANLLGIKHLLVCVNKMDLRDYDQNVFDAICKDFGEFVGQLDFPDVTYVPISALKGVNIIRNGEETPWYKGQSVIGYLETVHIAGDRNLQDFRLPVQYVLRPNLDYRGFSGQIVSGIVKKGDPITVLPSLTNSHVKSIDTYSGELDEAFAPQSITLRLEDEIDISRGDVIAPSDNLPTVSRRIDAHLVWMSEEPLDIRRSYLIKHTTRYIRVDFNEIQYRVDLENLEHVDASQLVLNDIARVTFTSHRPLVFDPYVQNRSMGAFIVIDAATDNTVAAGMISGKAEAIEVDEEDRTSQISEVGRQERSALLGQRPATLWITGGQDTQRAELATALERLLIDKKHVATILDPTDVLTPSGQDLVASTPKIAAIARRFNDAGIIVIVTHPMDANADANVICKEVRPRAYFEITLGTEASQETINTATHMHIQTQGWSPQQEARNVLSSLIEANILDHTDH